MSEEKQPEKQPEKKTDKQPKPSLLAPVADAPGEVTGVVGDGKEIKKYYEPEKEIKVPNSDIKADDARLLNSAILLSEYLGVGSFGEAVLTLLAAKSAKSDLDLGIFKAMKGAKEVAESIERNLPQIREARLGSLEGRLIRVSKLVQNLREQFEAKDGWAVPLATLANHAVVMNSKGELFRASLRECGGDVQVTHIEKYGSSKLESKVRSAVEALMEGRKAAAKIDLKELLHYSSESDDSNFAKARHGSVLREIKKESFWKSHVKENSTKIRTFVRGELAEVYGSGIRPGRFKKARLGETNQKVAQQYSESVKKALRGLLERFEKMQKEIRESYTRDQWILSKLPACDPQNGVQMSNFMSHYVGELLNSLTTVTESIKMGIGETDLPFQAYLYDTLAEEYPTYALGYLFAKKALNNIRSGV